MQKVSGDGPVRGLTANADSSPRKRAMYVSERTVQEYSQ